MKGVIFTEFLDFVETRSGYETVDAILEKAAPASGGAYTAVGNYHFSELVALLAALSRITGTPLPELLSAYGRHLFGRFACLYPAFFETIHDPFEFLENVEGRIHVDVLKLYPDAELPQLQTKRIDEDRLRIRYRSCRPLGQLCIGLIEGCGDHFNVEFEIRSSRVPDGLDITVRRCGTASSGRPREAAAPS
jgi:hypothetical protein